jgi:predicted nuclease with RNAse H fold
MSQKEIFYIIDTLDRIVEDSPLNEPERNTLRKANDLVVKLRHDEESKWA